jgi:hypothetical protein
MVTEIYYENGYDKPITEQQLGQMTDYNKAIKIDGALKLKEIFTKNNLVFISYYKDQNESETDAINFIITQYSGIAFEIIDKSTSGAFTIETVKGYDKNGIWNQYELICLYDSQGRLIYEKESDDIEVLIKKWYYSYLDQPLLCRYNEDTGLIETVDLRSAEEEYTLIEDFINCYMPDFLTNNPYYADATLLPSGKV